MKKMCARISVALFLVLLPALCAAQQSISEASSQQSSEESLQASSEDSLQASSEQSSQASTEQSSQNTTQQSSQATTDESSQNSSQQTTGASSEGSSQATADSSANLGDASAITLIVGGAVVAVGLTALGVTLLVEVTGATQSGAIAFQDEIYSADGPQFARVVQELGIEETALVRANDEVVADGHVIESDQDAADYLVALMLRLDLSRPAPASSRL